MKKSFFKNKYEMVISIIIFCLLLFGFIYFGNKDYTKVNNVTKEKKEETVEVIPSDDPIYININASDALNYIKGRTFIILFGTSSDFSNKYKNLVSTKATELGINEIYYYDIEKDRKENNASYRSIVEYLNGYATFMDDGTSEIYAPTLFIKKNNNIILFDNTNALINGKYTIDEYYNEVNINRINNKLELAFKNYMEDK